MRIVMTGAGGLMGRGITSLLAGRGALAGRPITELVLSDRVAPAVPPHAGFRITSLACDVRDADAVRALLAPSADVVFHLAAIMSGAAERDFALGWAINFDGTRNVLEACRSLTGPPRLIFTSTIALYGSDVPDPVPDDVAISPRNAYGTQKAIAELMINEYSRRAFIDGRIIRVAHVAVRSDNTHQGAGAFVTAIVRGPLMGNDVICPVPLSMRVGTVTPITVFRSLLHAAELAPEMLNSGRVVQLPALTLTVAEIIEAVGRAGGKEAINRITVRPDAELEAMLRGMPPAFSAVRAGKLGFPVTPNIDGAIAEFLEQSRTGSNPAPTA
jgi:nucleoside-diphosphate-sugar epimerase